MQKPTLTTPTKRTIADLIRKWAPLRRLLEQNKGQLAEARKTEKGERELREEIGEALFGDLGSFANGHGFTVDGQHYDYHREEQAPAPDYRAAWEKMEQTAGPSMRGVMASIIESTKRPSIRHKLAPVA